MRIESIFLVIALASLAQSEDTDSFKAIESLHTRLDHDADGEVEHFESERFLESDKNGAYKLKYLHQDDTSISVNELWEAWVNSAVHNWTVDDTVQWLVHSVELPEYSQMFTQNLVNGTFLPKLATDSQFVSKLGITDPSAKQKISIKAMDAVLFGPPKSANNSKIRDVIVSIVIVIAISSCYVFYSRSLASQQALRAMQHHVESLQKAEDYMQALQEEKKNLEHQLDAMQRQSSASNLSDKTKLPLRTLLKQTYDIESHYYHEKRVTLELKANELKTRNQKLQKKKTSFLGYYKMAQENSLEEDINTIVEVKEAIMQISKEMKERTERWRAIEEYCGFPLNLGHNNHH